MTSVDSLRALDPVPASLRAFGHSQVPAASPRRAEAPGAGGPGPLRAGIGRLRLPSERKWSRAEVARRGWRECRVNSVLPRGGLGESCDPGGRAWDPGASLGPGKGGSGLGSQCPGRAGQWLDWLPPRAEESRAVKRLESGPMCFFVY